MCKQFSDAHTSNLTQATAAHYLTLNRLPTALAAVRATYAERGPSDGGAFASGTWRCHCV